MTYKLAAWLTVSLATTAGVASTYTVKDGDTLSGIAHKFHVRQRVILSANDLKSADALRVGLKLHIPSDSVASSPRKVSSVATYVVRNGDNDWAIAHRLHISLHSLHVANPRVDWDAIQTGQHLLIPGGATSHSMSHVASVTPHKAVHGGGTYTVREDDNDWTISAKLGITNAVLRHLNPSVHWSRIQPGQKLNVPRSVASKPIHHIETRYARINADEVTLRRGPSTDSDKVTSVDEGTKAKILDREHGWYKLRFPKGTVAWVRGDFLSAVHAEPRQRTYASRRHSSKHSSHSTYASHSRRRRGHTPELALSASEVGDNAVLRTAMSYRGTRYSYGSSSRSATDCSGFTVQVMRKHGVHLPRTAREQSGVGSKVARDGLKKGDLVFFHTMRSSRVNHVGIYIGNGKFIHASSGGGHVQVNSLSDGYYSRRFVGGRRVVKDKSSK